MVNMSMTGAYISSLRKAKDMTQVELADQLNVSHQAVSKWERGESLPDVATLPKLASILEVSIDDILAGGKDRQELRGFKFGGGDVVREILEGSPGEIAKMIRNQDLPVESVLNLAPILKARDMDRIAAELEGSLDFGIIVNFAPFIDQEILGEMVVKAIDTPLEERHIQDLAPFVSHNCLELLLEQAADLDLTGDFVVRLAPFLRKEILGDLVLRLPEEELNMNVAIGIAPFIGRENLDQVIDKVALEGINPWQISELAPFLKGDTLNTLLQGIEGVTLDLLVKIAPFLDRENLNPLLQENLSGEVSPKQVHNLAPFVGQEVLSALFEGLPEDQITYNLVAPLTPFLGRDMLTKVLKNLAQKSEPKE